MLIFCFSQIMEVNANLWRGRLQDGVFMTMVVQEKDMLVQVRMTNMDIVRISDKNSREKDRSPIIEKVMIATIALFIEKFIFRVGVFFKRWAESALSQAFQNWRASLYR
ncbi:hypothetical protein RM11_0635 [Bartonella quintana RM-11]|nr:hypothetical protein RM11_0635 [Bartonella quintana RM-11]